MFGIDVEIIDKALKTGIELINDGEIVTPPGTLSLVYHPSLKRYVFVFGTSAANASFVLLEDFNKLWKLK